MGNIANDALMQDLGQVLQFFQLDLTSINPSYPITYWVQSVATSASSGITTNSPIIWTLEYPEGSTPQTIVWNPIDLQIDQWETSSQGALPRPKIRLANVLGVFTPSIIAYGDMVGGTVRRFRTYAKYLDGQPAASPSAYYGPDEWRIERKVSQNPLYVDFELASWMDQQNVKLPYRTVIRDYCLARYRVYRNGAWDYSSTQCPYTGTGYWDQYGNATIVVGLDQCGKQKSDCLLRFPNPAALPFWGFLGVERINLSGGY